MLSRLFKRNTPPLSTSGKVFDRKATLEDLVAAYRLLLQRFPDEAGFRSWSAQVDVGLDLDRLVSAFLGSDEFRSRTRSKLELIDLGGYFVCFDAQENDFGKSLAVHHDYEPHLRQAIRELFKPGQVFIDIGANIGCISFLAASIAGPSGRVIAIEPNPQNVQRLYAGIKKNGFTNVDVYPYGASDVKDIFSVRGGDSNTMLFEADSIENEGTYTQSIIVDEMFADLKELHIIKMDIEGYEPHALAGCSHLIRKHRPILITEFNPRCLGEVRGTNPRDYLEQIFSLYARATALTGFDDRQECASAQEVLDFWTRRNEEVTRQGLLPENMLHLDLIATM